MLSFRNLSKNFGSQKVLQSVSGEIQSNQKIAIIGKSGQGKSVLFKMITGLLPFDEGEVFWKTNVIQQPAEWQKIVKHLGIVFQQSALLDSFSIAENIGFQLSFNQPLNHQDKIAHVLEKVGLQADVMKKMPAELSGGMRKRVAIARAIIHEPEILFLDEPTSGLDPYSSAKIDELIQELIDNQRTVVLITHDMISVKQLNPIIWLIDESKLITFENYDSLSYSTNETIQFFLKRK